MSEHYDVIIIGSGAGGGTLAYALSKTPARILIVERGDFIPQEDQNWDPEAVWKHLRYQTREMWLDASGREFPPYSHYNVGGNSKFWGSVLYRLRREDFQDLRHLEGTSPAWPIDYDTLEPYYERAERLYGVHGEAGSDPTEPRRSPYPYPPIPHSDGMAALVERFRSFGLHPSPLPLGLLDGCLLCNTCNSFACKVHAKSEADVCCIRPAIQKPTVTLWTNATAMRLTTNPSGDRVVAVEVVRNGETVRVEASLFVVSCGAVNSAALLLRSAAAAHPDGIANSSGLVGRRYMAHLATMMQGFHPFRMNDTVFQKTVAINDYYLRGPDGDYPLGQIQSQGRTHAVMAQTGLSGMGLARCGLAGHVGRPPRLGQPCQPGERRTDPAALPAEQPARTPAIGQGNGAAAPPRRILGHRQTLARCAEHNASVRDPGLRPRPARLGARPVLPHARRS
jgi:choline dehydrogenase-like flavoprotein